MNIHVPGAKSHKMSTNCKNIPKHFPKYSQKYKLHICLPIKRNAALDPLGLGALGLLGRIYKWGPRALESQEVQGVWRPICVCALRCVNECLFVNILIVSQLCINLEYTCFIVWPASFEAVPDVHFTISASFVVDVEISICSPTYVSLDYSFYFVPPASCETVSFLHAVHFLFRVTCVL